MLRSQERVDVGFSLGCGDDDNAGKEGVRRGSEERDEKFGDKASAGGIDVLQAERPNEG